MSNKNSKRVASQQARREQQFMDQFGERTLDAIDVIVNDRSSRRFTRESLAAYKANLTRGAYAPFVTVTKRGSIGGTLRV